MLLVEASNRAMSFHSNYNKHKRNLIERNEFTIMFDVSMSYTEVLHNQRSTQLGIEPITSE